MSRKPKESTHNVFFDGTKTSMGFSMIAVKILGKSWKIPFEVKYDGGSVTHNSYDQINCLNITARKSIDFLGVEKFNVFPNIVENSMFVGFI